MKRFSAFFALALGLTVAAHAQNTKTTTVTKTEGDPGKARMMTYTGCVQTGTQARTYVLNQAVAVGQTTTVSPGGGSATTVTTYALVPAETVTVQEHVGHKVQVTGMMIQTGDSKTTTTTKVDRDNAPDSKTKETTKTEGGLKEFRVTSIKDLAASCQ